MTVPSHSAVVPGIGIAGPVASALVTAGGRFMTSPEMAAAAAPLGIPGPVLYFLGRVGVLGATTAAAAASVLGIFPRPMITQVWADTAAIPVEPAVAAYAGACAEWGRHHLSGMAHLDRLAILAERVADAAPDDALPLAGCWRLVARPDDPPARAAHAIMLLRELRGGLHFCALRVHGLDVPLAVLGDPGGGVSRLQRTGWPPQAVDALQRRASAVTDLHDRWQAAESATDAMLSPFVETLTVAQRTELTHLLLAAESLSRPAP